MYLAYGLVYDALQLSMICLDDFQAPTWGFHFLLACQVSPF